MFDCSDLRKFLGAVIGEAARMTNETPATCRFFVDDFELVFRQLARRGLSPREAALHGGVVIYSAQLAGHEGALRKSLTCRNAAALSRRLCTEVACKTRATDTAVRRLATAALDEARRTATTAQAA
ncbi:MAG: hypothetical protein NXH83_03095 [Rhodobacteraceae bacterium]|nr:hypothetical protein [Paracoccaceae bacterium]